MGLNLCELVNFLMMIYPYWTMSDNMHDLISLIWLIPFRFMSLNWDLESISEPFKVAIRPKLDLKSISSPFIAFVASNWDLESISGPWIAFVAFKWDLESISSPLIAFVASKQNRKRIFWKATIPEAGLCRFRHFL